MRYLCVVALSVLFACTGATGLNGVFRSRADDEVILGRGRQHITYTSSETGLSYSDGSNVGDPSGPMVAAARAKRIVAMNGAEDERIRAEAALTRSQARMLRACARRMQSTGAPSETCMLWTHTIVQGQTARHTTDVVGVNGLGQAFLPAGGSWGDGVALQALGDLQAAEFARTAFASGGSRPRTALDELNAQGGRITAVERGQRYTADAVTRQGGAR